MVQDMSSQTQRPVLFVGGSGSVGRTAVGWFRERHPTAPLLVGGRDLQAARDVARAAGHAEAVAIDLGKPRLGLGDEVDVAAVVMLAPETGLRSLDFAQSAGVPYLNINDGAVEVGPLMAQFVRRPSAAPVVLASAWLGAAATFLALDLAEDFDAVHAIRIGAVLDEEDPAGPAALEDMERLAQIGSAALAFQDGGRVWLSGDAAKATIRAIDGRVLDGEAFAPFDVIDLPAATGAPNVRFDLTTAAASSRLRGAAAAAEIVVEVEGEHADGTSGRSRATLEFEHGTASLTGLGVVLALAAVLGLPDGAPSPPGLYVPESLLDAGRFLEQLRAAGAVIAR